MNTARCTADKIGQARPQHSRYEQDRWLAERIGIALGVPVRVLDGKEEARLAMAAYRRRVLMGSGISLGGDLGGGSLELVSVADNQCHEAASLQLGTLRLPALREAGSDAFEAAVREQQAGSA